MRLSGRCCVKVCYWSLSGASCAMCNTVLSPSWIANPARAEKYILELWTVDLYFKWTQFCLVLAIQAVSWAKKIYMCVIFKRILWTLFYWQFLNGTFNLQGQPDINTVKCSTRELLASVNIWNFVGQCQYIELGVCVARVTRLNFMYSVPVYSTFVATGECFNNIMLDFTR